MVKTHCTWTVVLVIVGVCSAAEDPVHFADANLKAAVEKALWVSDPTATDMLALTELVHPIGHTRENAITSLSGLQYAENLQTLNLRYHLISSLSPLSGLTNLRTIILNNNQISSISALSGLTRLTSLDIHDNQISSVSALSGLSNLETLILRINQISSISVLSGLTKLQVLDLDNNEVGSISALAGLTSLQRLDLRANPLNKEACDIYIAQIFANNPGIDFKYDPYVFFRVAISSGAGGSVIDPGEGEFTCGDGECIRLQAEADPCFAFVEWTGSYSATGNPVVLAIDQDYEVQARFQSVLETICVDDNAPNDPGPGDATLSDPQENGTPEHPFDEIQEALELATEGARIIVRAGAYCENIDLLGKSIELTGLDPNDPNESAFPVIDGSSKGTVMSFTRSEDPNCIVTGFVLTGGKGQQAAAILCSGSSPTISNCLIVGNRTTGPDGATIYCTDSNALFSNCTIADNYGDAEGAGFQVAGSNVAVVNSIIWNNGGNAVVSEETGAISIRYSDIEGGWPDLGNLDADPLFARYGYWADPDHPEIDLDPSDGQAVWMAGDYHLQSQAGRWDPQIRTWILDEVTSPCISAGAPLSSVGQESAPNGGIINMGTYGGSVEASKSHW